MLEREGYAVAAGSALGFVALGELPFMTNIPIAFFEITCAQKSNKGALHRSWQLCIWTHGYFPRSTF